MALDTAQKRMSAVHLGCPWRGPLVRADDAGFDASNRAAADFLYSGITPTDPEPGGSENDLWRLWFRRRRN